MDRRKTGSCITAAMACAALLSGATALWAADSMETLVFVRHGEKPESGLGQLDCKGLNRALALPGMLVKSFGAPAAIFAPDPAQQKRDVGILYDYVRPLATIEPTAIKLGLPVHTTFGLDDTAGLRKALEDRRYHNAVVFVAWEHKLIEKIARDLMAAHGGDPTQVGKWHSKDFDSIYVVTLTWNADKATAAFATKQEGLNDQSDVCPGG